MMTILDRTRLGAALDVRFESDLAAGRICGACACVLQHGETLYRRFVGRTHPNGTTPVGETSIFRLASMTKPITAVAVLQLAERGLLSLSDPIEKFLPEFANRRLWTLDGRGEIVDLGAIATKPTVLHLLTHTSGLGSGALGSHPRGRLPDAAKGTLADAVAHYAGVGLGFEPFTRAEYSPLAGFDLLARIVETVSGEEFSAYLKKNIFEPCDMIDTTFSPTAEQWSRLVGIHNLRDGKMLAAETTEGCVFEDIPCTHPLGGAGLCGTLEDYLHFAEMLRMGGRYGGRRVLGDRWVRLMSSPMVPEQVQPGYKRWGLSVRVIVGEGYRVLPVGAYGWSGAYGTHFWVDPVNGITAVYMRNSLYDGGAGSRTSYHFEEDVHRALI